MAVSREGENKGMCFRIKSSSKDGEEEGMELSNVFLNVGNGRKRNSGYERTWDVWLHVKENIVG